MAEKIDIESLKEDLAKKERARQAAEEARLDAARKANLDKLAKAEIAKREKRISDLNKSNVFLRKQIFELTQGGRISDEKKLREAISGYNSSIDLQSNLSSEISRITKGDYSVKNNKIVLSQLPSDKEKPKGIKPIKVKKEPETPVDKKLDANKKKLITPKKPDVSQFESLKDVGFRSQAKAAKAAAAATAETEAATEKENKPDTTKKSIQEIYDLVRSKYAQVDSIFLYEPELRELLEKAYQQNYKAEQFLAELEATNWAKRVAPTVRLREAEKRQYTEQLDMLNKQLEIAVDPQSKADIQAKIDEVKTSSNYARGKESTKGILQNLIAQIGSQYTPEQLDLLVEKLYDSATENDSNKVINILSGNIGYTPGSLLGGISGEALTVLRATAKANGFDLDTVYSSNINDWLSRIAKGESIETFKNVIRQQAKLGLPDKVANLLDQGLDLEQVFAPYKNLMASILEIPAQSIDISKDQTLRNAIGPKGEMSLFDFERSLRNDSRWEYTDNAREEVSSNVLSVLRSFGFQG
jgi:hypothetical protein